ncbi:reverse transcriptase domain-containing protein [Paenibacillus odorifer]|uniref:reverse transcriptase domain-containing protein n=1 Tax=Paenibacillus odorifer TaxID=189426 RepID=UPI00096C6FE3|nr:reverse transcriptase domain-containing protein [Paenibacillus odorifer]OMD57614.1 reverse transcriptase [Paenibacillus odorifer]
MKIYKTKYFTHFDKRIPFINFKDKIQNPEWVAQHGFYPFLHYNIIFNKYSRETKKKKQKIRKIYYASHIDGYIYSYYGDKINELYNELTIKRDIDDVSIAYRNNKKGKSNIHFAAEVINFITRHKKSYIFVADFSDFFDNLDHRYLKEKLKIVLNKNNLPSDYYNIFKNITKFSYINKKKLERHLIDIKEDTYFKRKERYLTTKQFENYKYTNIEKNSKPYGIPQGSGISAVLSNIYLLDFDQEINNFVKSCNGLYRRYCDDIIIVIPMNDANNLNFEMYENEIKEISAKVPNLIIQKEKTNHFYYQDKKISGINGTSDNLDYLGFRFDGERIYLREKSLFKFYSRAYRKIRICNDVSKVVGRNVKRRELYKTYTHLGRNYKNPRNEKIKGNFITYAERAQREFESINNIEVEMKNQVKKHWRKIQKRLINQGQREGSTKE